jgi:hypothetical protein
MGTFAEINWPRGQQYACAGGNVDHVRDAKARTARNTVVNKTPSHAAGNPHHRTSQLDLDDRLGRCF